MPIINGTVISMNINEEEGRTDWAMALSKIGWFILFFLTPLSIYRFVNDFFGIIAAGITIVLLLVVLRIVGPLNLVMIDEVICRIFPSFRSAFRTGRVRVCEFRIKTELGRQVGCILRGDIQGQAPVNGDDVRLTGIYRQGVLYVENGHNRTTNSEFHIHVSHAGLLLFLTTGFLAVVYLYLIGQFDKILYPLIEKLLSGVLS